jgi:hypothetical protein
VTDNWIIYTIIGAWRLDRLGHQLEAVCANIKAEVSPNRASEIMDDWKESKRQQAKDQRQFFIFWGIVVAAIAAWHFIGK